MRENTLLVKIVIPNEVVRETVRNIVAYADGYQVQEAGNKGKTDLLILELGENPEKEFRTIEELLNGGSVGGVFLTSPSSDQSLLLHAMRTGAKEFFPQPIVEKEVKEALERFRVQKDRPSSSAAAPSGRVINVIGSKGGIGATTIAVNLAVSLAQEKSRQTVALLDMNTLFGDIPIFLGLKPTYHLGEVTDNITRLDTTFLLNVLSRHSSGISILPSPGYLNGHRPATPEIIEHLLDQMQSMFNYIVIDGGQSLNETALRILDLSDMNLLISVLNLPCLSNVNRLLNSLNKIRPQTLQRTRVVINRYLKKAQVCLEDAERAVNRDIFWTIPNDYKTTMAAINQGKSLSQLAPRAAVTKSIKELASALMAGPESVQGQRRGLFRR
jgi:pilus assembly protein CpaE